MACQKARTSFIWTVWVLATKPATNGNVGMPDSVSTAYEGAVNSGWDVLEFHFVIDWADDLLPLMPAEV